MQEEELKSVMSQINETSAPPLQGLRAQQGWQAASLSHSLLPLHPALSHPSHVMEWHTTSFHPSSSSTLHSPPLTPPVLHYMCSQTSRVSVKVDPDAEWHHFVLASTNTGSHTRECAKQQIILIRPLSDARLLRLQRHAEHMQIILKIGGRNVPPCQRFYRLRLRNADTLIWIDFDYFFSIMNIC